MHGLLACLQSPVPLCFTFETTHEVFNNCIRAKFLVSTEYYATGTSPQQLVAL